MKPENALISRRWFPIDMGRVVVEEKWDTTHPDCPFVSQWGRLDGQYINQIVMTREQFDEYKLPIKP